MTGRQKALDGSIARRILDTKWRLFVFQTPHFMKCNLIPDSASRKSDPLRPFYARFPIISIRAWAPSRIVGLPPPLPSSCLELHHSTSKSVLQHVPHLLETNSPLGPLLIQHTVAALLAPNRISSLQGNFGVAVTA